MSADRQVTIRETKDKFFEEPYEIIFKRIFDEKHSSANVERITREELVQLRAEIDRVLS